MKLNLESPPGFRGIRDDPPLKIYRRNLPHWRQDGATYFTTFRLADSLPVSARNELVRIKKEWELAHPESNEPEILAELYSELGRRSEAWLDAGHGSCFFRDPGNRKILENALRFFDFSNGSKEVDIESRYELGAYVTMPNHVHGLVRPLLPEKYPLEKIEQSWKSFSTREINRLRNESGSIWFEESFDRIVRDVEHLYRCVQYIGRNPSKAGLSEGEVARWVNPSWEAAGWGFRAK